VVDLHPDFEYCSRKDRGVDGIGWHIRLSEFVRKIWICSEDLDLFRRPEFVQKTEEEVSHQ
jgi:hypothetical protein